MCKFGDQAVLLSFRLGTPSRQAQQECTCQRLPLRNLFVQTNLGQMQEFFPVASGYNKTPWEQWSREIAVVVDKLCGHFLLLPLGKGPPTLKSTTARCPDFFFLSPRP